MSSSLQEDRNRLLQFFTGAKDREVSNRWDQMWQKGDYLPFDRGQPNPALEDILSKQTAVIGDCYVGTGDAQRRKKALVPGMGRGYDVQLLASFGYDAYGLEISAAAVERAKEEHAKSAGKYPIRDEAVGAGSVTFVCGDFFDDKWLRDLGIEHFEFIYDYTFLSALPPSLRPQWSHRMASFLERQSGNLVCIEFPTYKDPASGGPPWALPPKVYMEHLSHPGEEIEYGEDGRIKDNPLRRASANGLERVAHWQPERTHEIGRGTDWVSIWRHR